MTPGHKQLRRDFRTLLKLHNIVVRERELLRKRNAELTIELAKARGMT